MAVFLILVAVTFVTHSETLKYVNSGVGLFALLSFYLKIGDWVEDHDGWKNLFLNLSYASLCMYLFHREIYIIMLKIWNPANPIGVCLYLGIAGVIISTVVAYYIQLVYDKVITKVIK